MSLPVTLSPFAARKSAEVAANLCFDRGNHVRQECIQGLIGGRDLTHRLAISRRNPRSRLVIFVALAFGFASSAIGGSDPFIPPGFLGYPPHNGFAFEAMRLVPPRHDGFNVVEADDYTLDQGMLNAELAAAGSFKAFGAERKLRDAARARQAKMVAVPDQFVAEFKAMQSATSGDAAFALGKDLPESIRLYTAAAVDFHLAHPTVIDRKPDLVWPEPPPPQALMNTQQRVALGHAITRFQAVLDLPDAEKIPRAVKAAYMLGRCYALRGLPGDAAQAERAFVLTRALARTGLPDPDGLAVASFGDQARLQRAQGDLGSTVYLYAEQAAHGSVEGVESLKWVAQALYADPKGMAKAENLPLVQQLLIAYALEVNDDGWLRDFTYTPGGHHPIFDYLYNPDGIAPILETARQWPKEKIASPDRLAALAYRSGDLDFARSLVANQDTALAWWLRAKLLVGDGKLAEAEDAYRKVQSIIQTRGFQGLSPFNASGACAEMAQLERARGEFIRALSDMVTCNARYDIVGESFHAGLEDYLAERVLTTKELQRFVDALPLNTPKLQSGEQSGDRSFLRFELAKRLIRDGRLAEATHYATAFPVDNDELSFDTGLSKNFKTQRDLIQAYVTAHDQSQHADSPVARAAAWYQLALLTRVHYWDITGHDSPLFKGEAKPEFPGVSSSELDRLKRNYTEPDQDNLHWYIAYDDALKAAQLVPTRSQAYAAILCHAAHWMYQAPRVDVRDPDEIFKDTYRLYLQKGAYVPWGQTFGRHCPDPDFEELSKPAWRRELESLMHG